MTQAADIARVATDAYNRHDVSALAACYGDNAILSDPMGTVTGRAEIEKGWAEQLAAFPDATLTVHLQVIDDDQVADEWTFSGTNTGDMVLPDGTTIPATGARFEINGMDVMKIVDGKIAEHRLYFDNSPLLTMLQQAMGAATA